MIALLTGCVFDQGEDWVILDCGTQERGVGYLVFCSQKTLAQLPPKPQVARLLIETHVREDHIHLYGFTSAQEKLCFKTLLATNGVGAKVALALLSALTPDELAMAIASEDKAAISRAKGVGAKLAQRLIVELKDKMGTAAFLSLSQPTAATEQSKISPAEAGLATDQVDNQLISDVISALANLGYAPSQAFSACAQARKELGEEADFDQLFRNALTRIAG